MKICSSCRELKSLDLFHADKNCKDGKKGQCRVCKSIYSKKHNIKPNVSIRNKELKSQLYLKNLEKEKEYRQKHRDHISKLQKRWYSENRQYAIKKNSERTKKRIQTDLNYKLTKYLRTRLRNAVKNNQKTGSAIRDLGCSMSELKKYLESKWQPGMTWDNYGFYGWHIDHVRPLASFDLSNSEQCQAACHYMNLQPLWASDNFKKSDSLIA